MTGQSSPQPGVRITEVDEEGEAVAEDESNVHMQAAEMQLMAPREVEEDSQQDAQQAGKQPCTRRESCLQGNEERLVSMQSYFVRSWIVCLGVMGVGSYDLSRKQKEKVYV